MPRKRRLTPREKKLFEGVVKGLSITDAAREAGYSDEYAGQAGSRALQNIEKKAPDLFERHGLGDDDFVEKCIKPALFAEEVKVFSNEGNIVYSEPLIAWSTRTATNALVAKMKGMIREVEPTGASIGIRVLVINGEHRPPRESNTAAPPLEIPCQP